VYGSQDRYQAGGTLVSLDSLEEGRAPATLLVQHSKELRDGALAEDASFVTVGRDVFFTPFHIEDYAMQQVDVWLHAPGGAFKLWFFLGAGTVDALRTAAETRRGANLSSRVASCLASVDATGGHVVLQSHRTTIPRVDPWMIHAVLTVFPTEGAAWSVLRGTNIFRPTLERVRGAVQWINSGITFGYAGRKGSVGAWRGLATMLHEAANNQLTAHPKSDVDAYLRHLRNGRPCVRSTRQRACDIRTAGDPRGRDQTPLALSGS